MGKKGGGKKGKKDAEPTEPPHDPGWERVLRRVGAVEPGRTALRDAQAVQCGRWERPPDALPDASSWPTWGALRERILTSCKQISITWSNQLRDAFPTELIKLSPPNLTSLELRGCGGLTRFTLSPVSSCPKLSTLDLSACGALAHVLVQSASLDTVLLSKCVKLGKALLHAKCLRHLDLDGCEQLQTLIVWSDDLKELDLRSCINLHTLDLYCPNLQPENLLLPTLKARKKPEPPKHPPIVSMLKEMYADAARVEAERNERNRLTACSNTVFAHTFHKCAP